MTYSLIPKIIILDIDGLEYNLIKEWNLENNMQKAYCKLNLSVYNKIVTPSIWGSIFTRKIDEKVMKIRIKLAELSGDEYNIKQRWWVRIAKILPFSVNFWIWNNISKRLLLWGDPFEIIATYATDKKLPNIFQFFEKPWTNNISRYRKNVCSTLQKKLQKILSKEIKYLIKNFINKNYKKDKSLLLSALDKQKFNLFFWYTKMIDNFDYIVIGIPITLIMKYYLEINEVIGKVKE